MYQKRTNGIDPKCILGYYDVLRRQNLNLKSTEYFLEKTFENIFLGVGVGLGGILVFLG